MKTIIDKSETRGYFNHSWLKTYHTFSFADYYNPLRMGFGALRVLNDDTVLAGHGFDMHPHKNMEVVSIPLKGNLTHNDSGNNLQTITTGEIQLMSAGTGIIHSEYNNDPTETVEFLQIWIQPKTFNQSPKYQSYDIQHLLQKNKISYFIAPEKYAANIPSINQDAWFSFVILDAGTDIDYKLQHPRNGVYIFILEGEIGIAGEHLHERDGIGIWETEELQINATTNTRLLCIEVPMEGYN